MDKICRRCKRTFRSKAKNYCSERCFHLAQIVHRTVRCPQCGGEFKLGGAGRKLDQRFCSMACSHASQKKSPVVKICMRCKMDFEILRSPSSRKKRPGQLFCSDACKFAARYRSGRVSKKLSTVEAAYLAGIIDGEGTISLYMNKGKQTVQVSLSIANTDRPLLNWARLLTGLGDTHFEKQTNPRHKIRGRWRCGADAAISVIRQIKPFLKIKSRQADLAILARERLKNVADRVDRSWQSVMVAEARRLNKTGPIT